MTSQKRGSDLGATRYVYVEEGAPSIEQRMIRLGPAASFYQTVFPRSPSWITQYRPAIRGQYGYAQPGIHYESVGQQGDNYLEWGEFDEVFVQELH